eukprot:7415795-Pyramimonas_sp.AAC.2
MGAVAVYAACFYDGKGFLSKEPTSTIWKAFGKDWAHHAFPVVMGADFNVHPDDLLSQAPWGAMNGTVRSSAGGTFSSGGNQSLIDFFCISSTIEPLVESIKVQYDIPSGVQFPVQMRVRLAAQEVRVKVAAKYHNLPTK